MRFFSSLSRARFRPTLIPTLFTIPAVLVMIGLSAWQIERLQWKNALIAEREAKSTSAPIGLDKIIQDVNRFEFQPVTVTGTFLHDREMLILARTRNGKVGYHVVTPMALVGRSTILVNRGWIPIEAKDPAKRVSGQVASEETISGIVRFSLKRGFLQPENDADSGSWYYIDVAAMAKKANLDIDPRFYIEAGPIPNPGGLPIGSDLQVTIPNHHLQYAITWGLLAIALIVIYGVYHWKRE